MSHSFRTDGDSGAAKTPVPNPDVQADQDDASLRLEQILLKQFEFAGQISQNSREDTSNMIYLYFVMVGVVLASLGFLLQVSGSATAGSHSSGLANYAQLLMLVALLGAGVVHVAFYARWVRLRWRYIECFARMSRISEFYIQRFDHDVSDVADILRWQPKSFGHEPGLPIFFTVFSILPVLGSFIFAGAAIVGGELWLNTNGGALFPLPQNLPLYAIAGAVFFLSLLLYIEYALRIERNMPSQSAHKLT